MDIAFPNLGIYFENVPRFFEVFGFKIAFYGLIIGIGIMLGIWLAAWDAKKMGLNPEVIWDFAIYAVIFSIIGARLYYVAFSWDLYKDDLLSIFNTRNGGMAIYGGVIGAFLTLFVFSKLKKVRALQIGDSGVLGLILGQCLGRWGNFMNREAFGEYSDGLLAMRLPIDAVRSHEITDNIASHIEAGANYIQVHPTFLYESLWNLLLLVLLLLYRRHKKFHGEICLLYLGGYGLGRFWVESLRTDQLLVPGTSIAVSQVVALTCVTIAIVGEIVVRVRIKKGRVEAFSYAGPYVEPPKDTKSEEN
ncbi:MAG: prolipoprotein diacylglyceryl transferase [Lachnospiraceae bacterium]|nr:prolipoprotein diacylglyceryl transferase [Lachnospiraceae bacterium]